MLSVVSPVRSPVVHRLDQIGLPGADGVGIGLHKVQAGGRQQVGKGTRVVLHHEVVGLVIGRHQRHAAVVFHVVRVNQLHEPDAGFGAQVLQVGYLERLHEHGCRSHVAIRGVQRGHQLVFKHVAPEPHHVRMEGGMLDLGVDAHCAAGLGAFGLDQCNDPFVFANAVKKTILLRTKAILHVRMSF